MTRRTKPGAVPPSDTCNARHRRDLTKLCRRRAGAGTDHVGVGRCKLHGGSTPISSGRYSRIERPRLRALITQYEADPDPLNIEPELAAMRALFHDFVERYEQWQEALIAWHLAWKAGRGSEGAADSDGVASPEEAARPRQVLDIAEAHRLLEGATKIVERIDRMRNANAISRPELMRVMDEMGRVVVRHVPDPALQEKIRDGWLSIAIGH